MSLNSIDAVGYNAKLKGVMDVRAVEHQRDIPSSSSDTRKALVSLGTFRAPKGQENLYLTFSGAYFIDDTNKIGKRTVSYPDALPLLEANLDTGGFSCHLINNDVNLIFLQWYRSVVTANETGDPGGIAHYVPVLIAHLHVDKDITRQYLPGYGASLATFDLDLVLGRDDNIGDIIADIHQLDPLFQIFLDALLMPRVGVDYEPVFIVLDHRRPHCRKTLFDRFALLLKSADYTSTKRCPDFYLPINISLTSLEKL